MRHLRGAYNQWRAWRTRRRNRMRAIAGPYGAVIINREIPPPRAR